MSLQRTVMGLVVVVGSAALSLVACAAGGGAGGGDGGSGGGGPSQGGGDAQSVAGSTSGGVITTGPGSTGATTTTTAASSSSTGGGNTCDVLAADSCDDCIESKCCVELLACKDDPACWSCFTSAGTSGCPSNPAFIKVATCVVPACGPVIDMSPNGEGTPPITDNPCHFAPPAWTCDSAVYDQAYKTPGGPVVCNCECGPYLDPDCAVAATSTCGPAASCTIHCGCLPDGQGCQ